MDSEPHLSSSSSSEIENSETEQDEDHPFSEGEEPYTLNGSLLSLLGFGIAFIMLFIPLLVVSTEKPPLNHQPPVQ